MRPGFLYRKKLHWGWCQFIELNILCKLDASKLLLVMFVKCPFCPGCLALWWYSLIWQRRTSHIKSDPSSTENTFGMPFKKRNLPLAHQCSERERQYMGVLAIVIGEVDLGLRQGWFSWAKRHWGWSPYSEVNVWNICIACNLLSSGFVWMAILPCLYKLALCCFPCLCKQGMVMPKRPCPEWRTFLKCFSGTVESCTSF